MDAIHDIYLIVAGFIGLIIDFLPSIIAFKKKHNSKWAIFVLNFFTGWTIIGWIACFIWAFNDNKRS